MTVKYEEYIQDKQAFFNKHDNEFTIQTSSMDEYSRYHKEYIFDDGPSGTSPTALSGSHRPLK